MRRKLLMGVLLTLALLALIELEGGPFLRWFGLRDAVTYMVVARALFVVWALIVWLYVLTVERQPLRLWQEKPLSAGGYLLSVLGLYGLETAGMVVIGYLFLAIHYQEGLGTRLTSMLHVLKAHPWLIFYSAALAGLTEELTFRGYLLPRLEILLGHRVPAIILSSVLFSLAHLQYRTVHEVVSTFVIGMLLALYYDRYRNIKAAILFHALWDVSSVYLLLHRVH
jgi:membrane protease YdiL (CAAX protease family)